MPGVGDSAGPVIGFDEQSMGPELIRLGWRPPSRVVTDPAGLDELADASVVVDATGTVQQRLPDGWATPGDSGRVMSEAVPLPATVLSDGG